MELTSIYGEIFQGEIVAELENVLIAEDLGGERYVIRKEQLTTHKPKRAGKRLKESFDYRETMINSAPPQRRYVRWA